MEPPGNHRLVNACGRGALRLLLCPDAPLPEALSRESAEQFAAQFLPDGGHIERAPHYHVQTLVLLGQVLRADAHRGGMLERLSLPAADRARAALVTMLAPDGAPVRFGDSSRSFSGRLPAADVSDILGSGPTSVSERQAILPDFGIATWTWDVRGIPLLLAVDFGPVGLEGNSGHGHGDALSYCLYVDGEEVVADPGTYLYSNEPEAMWFKRPQAHNTVWWKRHDCYDLATFFRWRRTPPAPAHGSFGAHGFTATLEWRRGSCRHRHSRCWRILTDGLEVRDQLASSEPEPAIARLTTSPPVAVQAGPGPHRSLRWAGGTIRVEAHGAADAAGSCVEAWYAPRYGVRQAATALEWAVASRSPASTLVTKLTLEP